MDFERIKQNLLGALSQLMALRLIVSSPSCKVADLPAAYVLFAALMAGVIRIDQVKDAADFLIAVMPAMFIPAAVGLLDAWGSLQPVLLPVCAITVVSTVFVMGVTGRVTQRVLRTDKLASKEADE